MSRFIQLHLLASYPPSNPNRDDLGRPKTAVMGGVPRLRISSQSLKRAWRKSELFASALGEHVGTRTKEMGREAFKALVDKGVSESKAKAWAKAIAEQFGKSKGANKDKPLLELDIEQLAHFSPEEREGIDALVEVLASERRPPSQDELKLLRQANRAADIALFGRMLASSPKFNVEAAAQVAHAISVHTVAVEDDFFTAVDDLNAGEDDLGAGHLGETEFAAALHYLYLCIDRELLTANLSGDEELAKRTLAALVEAVTKVAPTGKQNSFGSRVRATYLLAEIGDEQPRSLSVAFLKPVNSGDMMTGAVEALIRCRDNMDKVYGDCCEDHREMNAQSGEGSLKEIIRFITE